MLEHGVQICYAGLPIEQERFIGINMLNIYFIEALPYSDKRLTCSDILQGPGAELPIV